MTPRSFTDAQMQTILAGSERVHPQFRRRYLDSVVDQLIAIDDFSDVDVEKASSPRHRGWGCADAADAPTPPRIRPGETPLRTAEHAAKHLPWYTPT